MFSRSTWANIDQVVRLTLASVMLVNLIGVQQPRPVEASPLVQAIETPTPSATETATATASAMASETVAPSETATEAASASPQASETPSSSATPSETPSPQTSPSETDTPTPSDTPVPSLTPGAVEAQANPSRVFLPLIGQNISSRQQVEPQAEPTAVPDGVGRKADDRVGAFSLQTYDTDCSDGECVFPLGAASDDASTFPSDCSNRINDHNIYVGRCDNGTTPIVAGWRFPNIQLARGQRIYEAYIEFTLDGPYSTQQTSVGLYVENTANAGTFSVSSLPGSRALMQSGGQPFEVNWLINQAWQFDTDGRTPNIGPLLQSAVAQSGWNPGNAVVFIAKPNGVTELGPCGSNPVDCNHRRVFGYDRDNSTLRLARLVIKLNPPKLPPSQAFAANECPFCNNAERVYTAGQGVNTYSGNFNYQQRDNAVVGVGAALGFERSYNSLATGNHISYTLQYSNPLGIGWTHNFNVRLLFNVAGEPTTTVMMIAPRGSQMRFKDIGGGQFDPFAGVTADMVTSGANYIVTTNTNYVYTFDSAGVLQLIDDPQGHRTTLTYSGGRLSAVRDSAGQGFDFGYNGGGQLQSVQRMNGSTPIGNPATYTYTGTDLTGVTDSEGRAWVYAYNNHLLTSVTDPSGKTVISTGYDSAGRATSQTNGAGGQLFSTSYPDVAAQDPYTRTVTVPDAATGGTAQVQMQFTDGGCRRPSPARMAPPARSASTRASA